MLSRIRFPVPAIGELRREVEQLLDEFGVRNPWTPWRTAEYPALNIWDEGEALGLEAEIPGVKQDELEVFAMGNELTIKGRRPPLGNDEYTYHRQERGIGEFTRVVTLPVEVDAERIEATLADGVLTLRLPKAESAKPRKIALRTK